MTHFDFKTLLPALLQVEDRVSMAHGLESRVPFLDHPLVELAATMPADVKFKDGTMKHVLKRRSGDVLPPAIARAHATRWASRFRSRSGSPSRGRARLRRRHALVADGARRAPLIDNAQGARAISTREPQVRPQGLGPALSSSSGSRSSTTARPRSGACAREQEVLV